MGNNIVTLYVNEKKYVFSMGDAYGQVPQSETLLDTLRNRLGLTGAKKSCDQGACGCCTVIKDGDAVPSCMQLTVDCDGCHITTIEYIYLFSFCWCKNTNNFSNSCPIFMLFNTIR